MLNGASPRVMRSVVTFLALLALVLPGSIKSPLHGMPISPLFVIMVPLFFILIWTTEWWRIRGLMRALVTTLVIVCGVQFGASYLPPYGWTVCVESDASVTPGKPPCEPSPTSRSGAWSYRYPLLNFDEGEIPFYFVNNSGSYNFYLPNQPSRYELPYIFTADTWINNAEAKTITIHTNIPQPLITVNGETLVPDGATNRYEVSLPSGKFHLTITYATKYKPDHYLRVTGVTWPNATSQENIPFVTGAYSIVVMSALMIVLGIMGLIVWWSAQALLLRERIAIGMFLGAFLVLYVFRTQTIVSLPLHVHYLGFALLALVVLGLFGLQEPKAYRRLRPFVVSLIFLLVVHFITVTQSPLGTHIFEGGGDELGHETFARSVLFAKSWHEFLFAAESSFFYYQPLARFLLAGLHAIFGEPMWGPYIAQTSLFLAVSYLIYRWLITTTNKAGGVVFWVIIIMWASGVSSSLLTLMHSPYQQALALPLFVASLVGIYSLLIKQSRQPLLLGLTGLGYGLAIMTRSDLLPSILVIGLFGLSCIWRLGWRETLIRGVFLGIGLTLPISFVLYRNYSIGGGWVLFPTSTTVNLLTPFYRYAPYYSLDISASEAIVRIINGYNNNLGELIQLLTANIKDGFIGRAFIRQLLWYGAPILTLVALVWGTHQLRSFLLYLLTIFSTLLVCSSFFAQHNGVAMLGHFDYLLTLLVGASVSSVVAKMSKQHLKNIA